MLHFIDSLILFCQTYFFYYYEYILKRGNIYIEFYKHLIIKNKNQEAESIKNELPIDVDNFIINSGSEMKKV